jgi:hypothetical protein
VQVLDPAERAFPFEGNVRLRASEGTFETDTDGGSKVAYLTALRVHNASIQDGCEKRGARFLSLTSGDAPAQALRQLLTLAQ